MDPHESSSFFLYGVGRATDVLCIGNLVLGDYSNPTTARHYTHRPLTQAELKQYTSLDQLGECTIHSQFHSRPGIKVSAAGLTQLSFGIDADEETALVAKSGQRIVLKSPEEFLNMEILTVAAARDELRKWLSAATGERIFKLKSIRKPKIWLLTGIYVLKDARVFTARKKGYNNTLGVGSNTILDQMTIPVGGAIQFDYGRSQESHMAFEGTHVWAAQYQLLKAKYLEIEAGQDSARLPSSSLLYPKLSNGGVRHGSEGRSNRVQVHVSEISLDEEALEDDDRAYDEALEAEILSIEAFLAAAE